MKAEQIAKIKLSTLQQQANHRAGSGEKNKRIVFSYITQNAMSCLSFNRCKEEAIEMVMLVGMILANLGTASQRQTIGKTLLHAEKSRLIYSNYILRFVSRTQLAHQK